MVSLISGKIFEFEPIDYLKNGKRCVYAAQILKDGLDKLYKAETNYPMKVLLVHGIELLLKAFIQHFNKNEFVEIHSIKKLYDIAEKIDKSQSFNILTNELHYAVNKVFSDYYPDSVEARYKNVNSKLDFSLFVILKEQLIQPLEKVIHL